MADERCGGCIALVTEGGYDLQAFAASLDAVVETLSGRAALAAWPAQAALRSSRGRAAAEVAKQTLAPFWRF